MLALPAKVTPAKLTVLAVPTFLSAKLGALLEMLNTSLPNKPVTAKAPVAKLLPSYTLLLAAAVMTGVPGDTVALAGANW